MLRIKPRKGTSLRSAGWRLICLSLVTTAWMRAEITPNPLSLSYVHDLAWDATRSRFFVSTGSSIVIVNPETALVEDTITSGQVAGRIAISSDGNYLYAAIGSRGVIDRYQVQTHAQDLEITLGHDSQGYLTAATMVSLPGQPQSILIARGYWPAVDDNYFAIASQDVAIYDGAVQRKSTVTANVSSLYIRPSDSSIFGWGRGNIYRFAVNSTGVSIGQAFPAPLLFSQDSLPTWNGGLLMDRSGVVVDPASGSFLGKVSLKTGCALTPDSTGSSVLAAQGDTSIFNAPAALVQYPLGTFLASASVNVAPSTDSLGACDFVSVVSAWGADGIVISAFQHSGGGSHLVFLHAAGLTPVTLAAPPTPSADASGIVHLPLTVNDLAYDASRNLLWASVPGLNGQIGNSVVSIDPASGRIVDIIPAGSEPGKLALSTDSSRLFTISQSVPTVSMMDLTAKQLAQSFSVLDSNSSMPASMAVVPGQNTSLAVVKIPSGIRYASTISIYDNGVPRPNSSSNIKPGLIIGDPSLPFLTTIYPGDTPNSFYAADLDLRSGGGTHDIARLVFDANGITLDRRLNPLSLGDTQFGADLLFDEGHLYTSAGEVWSADTQVLEGTFSIQQSYAAVGIPILFPDRNQIAYAYTSALSNKAGIVLFDLATRLPVYKMPLPSSTIGVPQINAAVRAGPSAIAISMGGEVQLIPLGSLQPWPQYTPTAYPVATGVQRMDLPVNAIAPLPGTSKLVFTTPSTDGNLGNRVVVFNPSTNQVESAVFAGSEPTLLAPSADGVSVYASLAGERRVARVNVAAQSRDLVFTGDPKGGLAQYDLFDMAASADGGLGISYYGGAIAVFDNGVPRPQVDWNTQGAFAYTPATFKLAFATDGSLLYGYNSFLSTFDMKRDAVSASGLQWLSSVNDLIGGYSTEIRYSQGLLYASSGVAIDPERSRVVGLFAVPGGGQHVWPDPGAGRVYFSSGGTISVFDSNTHALLGSLSLTNYYSSVLSLVKYSDDGLAVRTSDGQILLVRISAIPLLAKPIPSTQPSLPGTAGVTLTDLTTADIAYDSSRNLVYASVPNSEAALGDQIATIDPETGKIVATHPTGLGPRRLALSSDNSQLFYTSGLANNQFYNGFSFSSEGVSILDLNSGISSQNFAALPPGSDSSYIVLDLTGVFGQPQSVAVINDLYQNMTLDDGTTLLVNRGPTSVRIYDNGTQRPTIWAPQALDCTAIQPAATADRLYCGSVNTFSKLAVDGKGVSLSSSTPLSEGTVPFNGMLFQNGRVYTTTGLVIDPEAGRILASLPTQGPVASDGARIYWVDPTTSTTANPNVTIRAFDAYTFQAAGTKQINVTSPDVTRLLSWGGGRLAFRAGHEIYFLIWQVPRTARSPGHLSISAGQTPLGKDMQRTASLSADRPVTNGFVYTVSSGDPSRLLVSSSPTVPGSAQTTIAAPANTVYLQSLASSGTVTVRVSAPGEHAGTTAVQLASSGAVFLGGTTSLTLLGAGAQQVPVGLALLDPNTLLPIPNNDVARAGFNGSVAANSSNSSVAAVLPTTLQLGAASPSVLIKPGQPGTVTISLGVLPGSPTPAGGTRITVTVPTQLMVLGADVGENMQVIGTVQTPSGPPPAGLVYTVTSSDPSRLLVSSSPTSPGGAQATITGPQTQVYLQGLANSGIVTLTVTSPGVPTATGMASLVPSVVAFTYGTLYTNLTLSANGPGVTAQVEMAPINPVTAQPYYQTGATPRPGWTGSVTVTSTNPAVATVSPTTLQFPATGTQFVSIKAGQAGTATVILGPLPFEDRAIIGCCMAITVH